MPTCVVPGCTSGYRSNLEKFHFFTIPHDPALLEQWKTAVKRESVKSGQSVCGNHFRKSEILWQRELRGADGRVLGVSHYKIPRLAKGAVPSIFPWVETVEEEEPPETNQRPEIETRADLQSFVEVDISPIPIIKFNKDETDGVLYSEDNNIVTIHPTANGQQTTALTFHRLAETEIKVPPGWLIQATICAKTNLLIFFVNKTMDVQKVFKTFILKAVTIQDDLSVQVTALSKPVDTEQLKLPSRIKEIKELESLLMTIHNMDVCNGCAGCSVYLKLNSSVSKSVRKDVSDMWRHNDCVLFVTNVSACQLCRKVRKTLVTKIRKKKSGQSENKRTNRRNVPTQEPEFFDCEENYDSS